jgi:1-deoxy-D-xylulose-5-phosphate synthase
MVDTAMRTLPLLRNAGVDATVVNARSAKPLDQALLRAHILDQTKTVVTLEEACLSGGFGAAVLSWAAGERARNPQLRQAPLACIGVPDHFVEHGSRTTLLDLNGLSPERVAQFVLAFRQH